ncbi:MAG TPA: hypothetical protein VHA33_08035 [Candidatus Angelobacter sp.]|jgi:hypothetical protein|nr:hypothetical protein [Candidatus Angelobacter sp.]
MARGWESKSVESQIESAQAQPHAGNDPPTDQQKMARRERDGLLLARSRVMQQLESSTNEVYRQSLQQALSELDEKIANLS